MPELTGCTPLEAQEMREEIERLRGESAGWKQSFEEAMKAFAEFKRERIRAAAMADKMGEQGF